MDDDVTRMDFLIIGLDNFLTKRIPKSLKVNFRVGKRKFEWISYSWLQVLYILSQDTEIKLTCFCCSAVQNYCTVVCLCEHGCNTRWAREDIRSREEKVLSLPSSKSLQTLYFLVNFLNLYAWCMHVWVFETGSLQPRFVLKM